MIPIGQKIKIEIVTFYSILACTVKPV